MIDTHGLIWRERATACLRRTVFIAMGVLAGAAAAAPEPTAQQFGDDLYLSGGRVTMQRAVPGDAVVAGGRVSVTGDVSGDALVAGGEVSIESDIGQDLYAAGGDVRVAGAVGESARLAGGRVTIAPDAEIAGAVTVAAGDVTVDGHVRGYALISAGRTQINGRIDGDLRVMGGELALGPNAVVQGRLEHHSATPARIAPGAQVQGGVNEAPAAEPAEHVTGGLWMVAVWLVGWIVAGAVLIGLAPRASRRVTQALREHTLVAPLLGVALLVGLPVLALLLLITVVGIPLGLLTGLLLLALLLLGGLATAVALGDAVAERKAPARTWQRIVATALALILLFALGMLPYVGWLVWLLALLFGVGAIVLAAFGARGPRAAPAAA